MSYKIALPPTVTDIIDEYHFKVDNIEKTISTFDKAFENLNMMSTIMGTYVEPIGNRSYLHKNEISKNLLISAWKAIYNRLKIDQIATAKDKQLIERSFANPPELTTDNVLATFRDYFERPRYHVLRGLAEVFTTLDPAYKSHSKVKIGVKGLPKRVIITGWDGYGQYAQNKFKDLANALATYQGIPQLDWNEISFIREMFYLGKNAKFDGSKIEYVVKSRLNDSVSETTIYRGFEVKHFNNGNIHVIFDKNTLIDINKALAEFYGEVLPDVTDDDPAPSTSTSLAKDLQFYYTPEKVVKELMEIAGIYTEDNYSHGYPIPDYQVLEPSCGDGRILDEIKVRGSTGFGFECHHERASISRKKGHSVVTANFLEQVPEEKFDKVVMNPPFYGRHYVKHINHALKFLKSGGILVSVLPATARYDHKELDGEWHDLPVGSFSETGTNIPTTILKIVKK